MIYARINLSKTFYKEHSNWKYIIDPDIEELNKIYRAYCKHKQFESVMPIFDSQYTDTNTDIIGYYDNNQLVGFSLIKRLSDDSIESLQFAWNYQEPKLRLGIESLKNECAIYKNKGFQYLYLGTAADYKSQLDGYEILGPI
jgi:hypothetical protein